MRKARSENFTVAGRLLPRALREHLLAIYGFARLVDDSGDESPGDRLALLDQLEADVDRIFLGHQPQHPLMRRIAATVWRFSIPAAPLRALIEANRRDQRQTSYETFDDLLGYCELSANPVGRLVLHVFGASTPVRCRLSDAICTGLQLVEHCQDVAEDFARGRVYLPAEDMRRFGCTRADLAAPIGDAPMRALIAFETARAREHLDGGAPLIVTLRGRRALAVAGFVAGGRAAVAAIEHTGFDVLGGAPQATGRQRLAALAATLHEAWRMDHA
jgi:squalene synthase HpnC